MGADNPHCLAAQEPDITILEYSLTQTTIWGRLVQQLSDPTHELLLLAGNSIGI